MNAHFYKLNITNIERKNEDLLTTLLFELGASGVSEVLGFEQLDAEYNTKTIEENIFQMQAYFESEPDEGLPQRIQQEFAEVHCRVSKEENKDWLEEWKKDFKPFCLVDQVWVVPSWLQSPQEASKSLYIDPGMAFGTGTHATTQIAAELLHELKGQSSLIDVGTGTGILALLAEHYGYDDIAATEIDDDARAVAKENVYLNKAKHITVLDYQLEKVDREFDVVLANIIDGVLVRIQKDLKRLANNYLILTGVLDERKNHFEEQFGMSHMQVVKHIQKDEWHGYLVKCADIG